MAIGGVLTAMVTPFDADGRLDEAAAVRLMKHLLDNGSDGLVLAGTTGEGSTLDDSEKLRLWQLAKDECPDALLIAGTGSNDTAHTVHLTEQASELGIDAMLVVTPYYNKPNPRGIKAHFEATARVTDKPIDGMDLLAGNDDMLARVMDAGGTGGILVASHLFGPEMKRIVEEPDARAG